MSDLSATKGKAVSETKAVKYEQEIPDVLQAMAGVHKAMDAHGFDRALHHLVQLRASQINRCAYCVKMHTKEARHDGETDERLDGIVSTTSATSANVRRPHLLD
jgi:AhpD family alkylhydroperoxidase